MQVHEIPGVHPVPLPVCKSSCFPIRGCCPASGPSAVVHFGPSVGCVLVAGTAGVGGCQAQLCACTSHSCCVSTNLIWEGPEAGSEPDRARCLLWNPDPFPRSCGSRRGCSCLHFPLNSTSLLSLHLPLS